MGIYAPQFFRTHPGLACLPVHPTQGSTSKGRNTSKPFHCCNYHDIITLPRLCSGAQILKSAQFFSPVESVGEAWNLF